MTATELRVESASLREQSEAAAERKARIARAMLSAEGPAYCALQYEQGVADCMMRRYRLWADQLELAARELEEP